MALNLRNILGNRNLIFLFALALGFLWDTGAQYTQRLIVPGLAVVMTLSSMGISGDSFRSAKSFVVLKPRWYHRKFLSPWTYPFGLSMLLIIGSDVSGMDLFLLLQFLLRSQSSLFPFFSGETWILPLFGTIGAYLGALVITPLIALAFLGTGFISPVKLLLVLGELIIGPLVLSRILIRTGLSKKIDPYKGPITNWSFFLVIYIMTGLNRDIFIQQPLSIVPVAVVAILTTFVLGWVIEKIGNYFSLEKSILTSFGLLATFKNYGLSGALALVFFNPQTAVPSTVTSAIGILYFIWLEMRVNRHAKAPA